MEAPVTDDLQRLASRLALLTSEDGEADNAGRAAGQLARRLGLSGGHLKAIFLAGVRAAGLDLPEPAGEEASEKSRRLEQEVGELRRLLDRSDDALRTVQRQHAELAEQNDRLHEALDRARTARQVWLATVGVLVAAGLGAVAVALVGPRLGLPTRLWSESPPPASSLTRMAAAGGDGAVLRATPDIDAAVLIRLPAGTLMPVRRLLWQGFRQWIETDAGGRLAYASVTDVDLQ